MQISLNKMESSLHLFQRPLYRCEGGTWQRSFIDSVGQWNGCLTWDPAAILSIISFGYVLGDRTLVKEIRRQPWLSSVGKDGAVNLEKVPSHDRYLNTSDNIAERFKELLCKEALEACNGFSKIYILLSGGLDSRIVAGIIYKLCKSGRITSDVTCLTWGIEGSRDVEYSRLVSKLIGFKWQHVQIGWKDLLKNSDTLSIETGGIVSPVHLHRMDWFCNIDKNTVVLAGSYGDSVGRAEFSGRHVLELDYLEPVNVLGLMHKDVLSESVEGINCDLEDLRKRCHSEPRYAVCECELEGHYMRNMLAHIMSVINNYGSLYQMFTAPDVYSYMWSLHPSIRDDRIYAKLLGRLSPELASMPWARTGRALKGKTSYIFNNLRKDFHDYRSWISGPIYEELKDYVEPEWFADTGIFDKGKVEELSALVESRSDLYGFTPYERWMWIAAFRRMAEFLREMGKSVEFNKESVYRSQNSALTLRNAKRSVFRDIIGRSALLYGILRNFKAQYGKITKRMKRAWLRYEAKRKYPPQVKDSQKDYRTGNY